MLLLMIGQDFLRHAGTSALLLLPLGIHVSLSLVLLSVVNVFGVHTWNTPFASLIAHWGAVVSFNPSGSSPSAVFFRTLKWRRFSAICRPPKTSGRLFGAPVPRIWIYKRIFFNNLSLFNRRSTSAKV
jgi:hypothetical protein